MSILLPDFGLLFWLLVAFGIVFFILAKFGFPAITSMVNERKRFIDESLENARKANERLSAISAESEAILKSAKEEQVKILHSAAETRELLIKEARAKAEEESAKIIGEARELIEREKEAALRDIRNQVAELSLIIAEKVLRKELADSEAQQEYTNKLVDEELVEKKILK